MKYSKIEARNDEWNRKFGFTEDNTEGFLLEIKNGIAYFAWNFRENGTRYYNCEESVFHKHFSLDPNESVDAIEVSESLEFSRYPVSK